MSVTVKIPAALRAYTDGLSDLALEGQTVGQIIDALVERYPDLGPHLKDDDGQLQSFVNVFVGSKNVKNSGGILAAVPDGETLMLVPAIAGGSGDN
ncbi:MAG: MoaD/ThiS family protein [Deltaproteobacteria bacterium]|jgi:molybdopterin converting factor small subunit|nr:MoaD/ThiS family protein [Deltaproteobacteria bacterium]